MNPMMKFLSIILLFFLWQSVRAQNLSNKGKDFWVGYGHHQFMEPGQSNSQEMVLYFSAEQDANVTVTINSTAYVQNYFVPAGTVMASLYLPKNGTNDCRLYSVPPSFGGTGGEGVFDRGIHIESDVPIVAYAHTFGSASSGATMLMPTDTWGYSYISINSKQRYANNCFSWAYVVANHDNTVVEITPSVLTRNGKPPGVPFNVTLNKGQIYQIIGANPTNGSDALEVSGTKFKSIGNAAGECYPVAAFSGSSRTTNPISCGSGGGDNDNQQLFPTQAWGKRYLTTPTSRSTSANQFMTNSYKVLVKDPTTVVKRNGVVLTGLQAGAYYFFESTTADDILADKPIMVAQFMTGGGCMGGGVGDPEMIYISPIEQGIKRIGFYRNTRENITVNYLTMVVPTAAVGSIRIDGSATFDYSYVHPQAANYTVVVKRWSAAQAQCIVTCDSAFTAITYGLGSVESYGYNAGTRINNLSALSSIHNTLDPSVQEHRFTCTNTPVELSVLMAYQPTRIDWLLSQLSTVITPSADVTDNSPVLVNTVLVNGVTYYKYSLPGTYSFNTADTFYLPIRGYHPSIENCYNREDLFIQIIVKEKPIADFSFMHSGCTLDTVHFMGNSATTNNFTIGAFNWNFPGPLNLAGQNQDILLPPGVHTIGLNVVSTEGCVSDTSKTITIYDKPPADFEITPATVCEGAAFTITDTASVNASISVNEWYWDFGNGDVQTVTSGASLNYTYPAYGSYTIRHVSKSSDVCISDTVSRNVIVYARPAVDFSYPAGCIDANGQVQFTGNVSVPDGQALANYAWDFGDANATGANPNTSALQSPTHDFLEGAYTINFSATTANGCVRDTTETVTFNLKPLLDIPTTAILPVCINATPLSVANAVVLNGVPGTGIYRGPGTDAAGLFTPSAAGTGDHIIWYVFTSTAGCSDSISQTIHVSARPDVSFTLSGPGCLPTNGQVQFTNTSSISDAQTLTAYQWDFGDPNANAGNPNTSTLPDPTHNYGEGNYAIQLTVTSSDGCVYDSIVTTTLSVKPLLDYPALNSACENIPAFSIAYGSAVNGVTGTAVYRGPGTDAAGLFTPALAGAGDYTIWYVFTTTGGCTDSVSQTIHVSAKPVVNFTFPAGGCLPTNGQIQFTGAPTIADAQTFTNYLWDFGDANANAGNPNTSTLQNPTHNYSEGNYTIQLTVTSSDGCTGDTSITTPLSVRPLLTYGAQNSVCENIAAVSVANAAVTNGVTGTALYRGPGTDAAGTFTPAVAGAGTHTIWYVFTTNGGCSDSIATTITVFPKPAAAFNVDADICLDQFASIADNSGIPSGSIVNWNWDFGDGTTASNTNGNPFTHTYSTFNNYTIQLTAISDRGCVSDMATANIAVHAIPVAGFSLPAAICMPGGAAGFTNLSAVPDNAALTYLWNFGDGNTSTAANPTHVYASSGIYGVTLTATSSFGCVNTANQPLASFFNKPVAEFNVSPDTLCQGTDNIFTDLSTDAASTLQSWNWNFADGSNSTLQNPVKRYNLPGDYNVSLTVTNAAGCSSDPFVMPVVVYLQPVIDAGPSFVVPQGTTIQFNPTVNDPSLSFLWTPAGDFPDPTLLKPLLVADYDQTYTLTATGQGNCNASDFISVKILKQVIVPNAFSPNGDGINDTWVITNLSDYPGATVEIYNRYGQLLYKSNGYPEPWDGTYNGRPLPVAAYYYVITLKNGFKPLTGSLTIVR
ncbi:MAG: PKD domain-containing protein [Terrimonas sp.]|nr:PKD domain-containing protein [Terrimonas sp.]